jgi:hypothetical protein
MWGGASKNGASPKHMLERHEHLDAASKLAG